MLATWTIGCMIINFYFTSDFTARLFAKQKVAIDSMEELIQRKDIIPILTMSSAILNVIRKDYKQLEERIEWVRFRDRWKRETIAKIFRGSHVFLDADSVLQPVTQLYAGRDLYLSRNRYQTVSGGFYLGKHLSPHKTKILLKV